MSEQRKIRVAVVFGGRGPEHAVSCMGGGNMLGSIDRSKYDVVPIGITREGNWVLVADEPSRLAITGGELPSVEAAAEPGSARWCRGRARVRAEAGLSWSRPARRVTSRTCSATWTWCCRCCTGRSARTARSRACWRSPGCPTSGAGVLSSAVSLDKEYMKLIFAAKGLPVGPYVVLRERDWPADEHVDAAGSSAAGPERKRVLDEIAELGWPLFVKPARGGSSIGTSKAHDLAQLRESIALARQYDPKVLVEAAVDGREVEVSVLEGENGGAAGHQPARAVADRRRRGVLGLRGQVPGRGQRHGDPGADPGGGHQEIRRLAALVFDAVSCEGLARVDFFYTASGEILVNEINTIPGLSPASYFQKMWEASGLAFPQLIDRLHAHRPLGSKRARPAPPPAGAGPATWLALWCCSSVTRGPTMTLR